MNVKLKSRRRLAAVSTVALVVILAGATAYLLRVRQLSARARRALAEGTAALNDARYYDALQNIGVYVQRHPDDADALYEYALAREHVEQPNGKHLLDAASFYSRALSIRPDLEPARRGLLALYLKIGFNSEAKSTAEMLLSKRPGDQEALYAQALTKYRLHDLPGSERALRQLPPNHLAGQKLMLDVMEAQGRTGAQIVDYATKLRADGKADLRLQLIRGIAYRKALDFNNARQCLETAARSNPQDEDVVDELVTQFNSTGNFDESLEVIRRSADALQSTALRRTLIGRLWQADQRQEVLDRTASFDPADPKSDAELLGMRAMTLIAAGQKEQADRIVQALASRRGDGAATAWAAVLPFLFAPSGATDDARVVRVCEDSLRSAPANPYIRVALGEAYSRLGDSETALLHWDHASAEAPAWAVPFLRSAQLLTKLGRAGEALRAAQNARARSAHDDLETNISVALAGDLLVGSPGIGATDLLQLVDKIQSTAPLEERTLSLQIRLLTLTGSHDGAVARVREALAKRPPCSESALLKLAAVSRGAQLGMDDEILKSCEARWGLTSDLALVRAAREFQLGLPAAGLNVLREASAAHATADPLHWRLAMARYLEAIKDPQAPAMWKALADERQDDTAIQWTVLGAASVQGDYAYLGRVLDRLQARIGDHGLAVKLARAQWLLMGKTGDREVVEASGLLNEVSRAAPNLLAAKLLLATCLERLGNFAGAVDQLVTVANLSPGTGAATLELARLLQDQRDFERAGQYLDRIAGGSALSAPQRGQAARLFMRQGDYFARAGQADKALEEFKTAADIAPGEEATWRQLTVYGLSLGRADTAADAAQQGVNAVPKSTGLEAVIQNRDLVCRLDSDTMVRPLLITLVSAAPDDAAATLEALRIIDVAKRSDAAAEATAAKLRAIANERPTLVALQNYLVQVYVVIGKPDAAWAVASAAIKSLPDQAGPARFAAETFAAAGRWSEAEQLARVWRQRAPQEAVAADQIIATSYLGRSQLQLAEATLRPHLPAAQTRPESEESAGILSTYAQAVFQPDHPEPVASLLQSLLPKSPRYRATWIALAGRLPTPKLTADWLRRAAASAPENSATEAVQLASAWYALSLRDSKFQNDARAAIDRADLLSQSSAGVPVPQLVTLALLQDAVSNLDAAEAGYRRALQFDAHQAIARNNLAMLLLRRHGSLDEARKLIEQAIADYPKVPHFYDTRAEIQAAQKQYSEAAASMTSAVKLDPDNLQWQVNLASILLDSGDRQGAKEWLNRIDVKGVRPNSLAPNVNEQLERLRITLGERT